MTNPTERPEERVNMGTTANPIWVWKHDGVIVAKVRLRVEPSCPDCYPRKS